MKPTKSTKSSLTFSSRIASLDESEADTTLTAISEAASKLAAVIAHRIECPDGKKEAKAHVHNGKATPLGRRRASLSQRPERVLSLWDRQDIFQEVNAFMAVTEPAGEAGKLSNEQIAILFRNCRGLLNMNGGRHDVTRCDEFDEAVHDRSIGSLESIERGSTQRLAFAAKLTTLRRWLWKGYVNDPSRKRRHNYHAQAATLRRIASHGNPFSRLTCPAIDPTFKGGKNGHSHYSDLDQAFTRFRIYTSIPWKVKATDIEGLAEAMTSL